MNNIQKFPHLEQWCKNYYDTVGLKVHPSNVPVDVVLNDLMGFMQATLHRIEMMTTIMEGMTERFATIEQRIEDILLNAAAVVVKETKVKK